jgi:hypothetical protein
MQVSLQISLTWRTRTEKGSRQTTATASQSEPFPAKGSLFLEARRHAGCGLKLAFSGRLLSPLSAVNRPRSAGILSRRFRSRASEIAERDDFNAQVSARTGERLPEWNGKD